VLPLIVGSNEANDLNNKNPAYWSAIQTGL